MIFQIRNIFPMFVLFGLQFHAYGFSIENGTYQVVQGSGIECHYKELSLHQAKKVCGAPDEPKYGVYGTVFTEGGQYSSLDLWDHRDVIDSKIEFSNSAPDRLTVRAVTHWMDGDVTSGTGTILVKSKESDYLDKKIGVSSIKWTHRSPFVRTIKEGNFKGIIIGSTGSEYTLKRKRNGLIVLKRKKFGRQFGWNSEFGFWHIRPDGFIERSLNLKRIP